jgi:hypothetical protein
MTHDARRSPETIAAIDAVLDFIRGNLSNIEKVWGSSSQQYKAAQAIMNDYLDENLRKVNVARSELDDLMRDLSLGDVAADGNCMAQ